MDDDGVVDYEAIIAMLPEDMQDELPDTMRKCKTQSRLFWHYFFF